MLEAPKNNLQSFIDSRVCKPIDFEIVTSSTPRMFLDSLRPVERKVVEACFKHGGYVAGGCPRYVSETIEHMGAYDEIDANAYRHFGDVDVFFPTEEAFKAALYDLTGRKSALQLSLDEDTSEYIRCDDSRARFAQNISVGESDKKGKTIAMQLIRCQFGDPRTILSKFDFLNSMIAFVPIEGVIKTIRAKNWLANESSNTLNVLVWDSPLSFYRIQKYVTKYGYQKLINGISSDEQLMKDMSKTMESLPFDVTQGSRDMGFMRARQWKSQEDGTIIFTQQNYASHVLSTIEQVGHVFTDEVVVFMLSLCMASGIVTNERASDIIRRSALIRDNWDPKKIHPRVDSWREAQRAALANRLLKQERGEEIYSFATR